MVPASTIQDLVDLIVDATLDQYLSVRRLYFGGIETLLPDLAVYPSPREQLLGDLTSISVNVTNFLAWLSNASRLLADRPVGHKIEEVRKRWADASSRQLGSPATRAVAAAVARRLPVNNLPPRVRHFSGRDEELHIAQKYVLGAMEAGAWPAAVSVDGMPGVGKSAYALEVARHATDMFPDAQLIIDCQGHAKGTTPLRTEEILDTLLLAVGVVPSRIPESLQARTSLWRQELRTRRSVIILDNAASTAQIRPALPGDSQTLVITTSRVRLVGLGDSLEVPLGLLSDADALKLMRLLATVDRNQIGDEQLRPLVELCGGLPLALGIVGAKWRRRRHRSILQLVSMLRDQQARMTFLQAGSMAVAGSFQLSFDQLSWLQRLAFSAIGLHPVGDVSAQVCAAMIGAELHATSRALEDLVDYSLLQDTHLGRYRMHDLLRDFSNAQQMAINSKAMRHDMLRRMMEYYCTNGSEADYLLDPHRFRINSPSVGRTECHNSAEARDWLDAEFENMASCIALASEMGWPEVSGSLAMSICGYMARKVPSWRAIEIFETTLGSGRTEGERALLLTEMALSIREAGRFDEAITVFTKARELWLLLGNNHGLAYCLDGLGFTLERLGDYTEAISAWQEARRLYTESHDAFGVACAINGLGAVAWRQEDYEEALTQFGHALIIRRQVGDMVGEGRTTNNIAFSQLRRGQPALALQSFQAALLLATDCDDLRGQTVILINLGYTHLELARPSEAITFALEGEAMAEAIGDNYQIGRALDVQSRAHRSLGHYDQADLAYNRSMQMFLEAGVPEGDNTAS